MMLTPRSLVAIAVLWLIAVTVQSRPTSDSGEPELDESAEPSVDPSVLMVPVRVLTGPESPFGKMLRDRLRTMSDHDLSVLESNLQTGTKTADHLEDQDMMMGDMPSVDDSQDSSSPAPSLGLVTVTPDDYTDEFSRRESPESADPEVSDKNLRIETIQNQMINFMGIRNPQILSPSPMIKTGSNPVIPIQQRDAIRVFYNNLNKFPTYPSETFIEKTQSFYPTCELPKHTSEDVWNTKESMNLMFNISLPKSSKGISINVNMARLRLYKQFVACYSQSSNETDDSQSCPQTFYVETMKQSNTNLSTAGVVPLIMDEKQIRVSIYAYTRSLKKKRAIKRKLLDSRMVPYYSEKWTEWNIRNAVKIWHKNPVRNYGISIEVEDEDSNLLPVSKFFRPMNCSGDAQMIIPKPVPGFIMEAVHNGYSTTVTTNNSNANTVDAFALSFNMHRYPIMDVTTVEMPESEVNNAMLYQYAKNAFEQVGGSGTAAYLPEEQEDQGNQHRIRHSSRQHRNNGTIPGSLSRDGHELRDQIIPQGVVQLHKPSTTESPDNR